VTIEFPEKREEYMGYCESAVGVGLMIGPVLGSAVFGFAGYEKTFYVFGTVIGIGLITVFFLLPSRLNHVSVAHDEPRGSEEGEEHEVDASEGQAAPEEKKVTFSMILTNKRAMIAAVASMFAMIFMLFFDSILSKRL
jgi:MFS family permease